VLTVGCEVALPGVVVLSAGATVAAIGVVAAALVAAGTEVRADAAALVAARATVGATVVGVTGDVAGAGALSAVPQPVITRHKKAAAPKLAMLFTYGCMSMTEATQLSLESPWSALPSPEKSSFYR
jgi:hypothetical protein